MAQACRRTQCPFRLLHYACSATSPARFSSGKFALRDPRDGDFSSIQGQSRSGQNVVKSLDSQDNPQKQAEFNFLESKSVRKVNKKRASSALLQKSAHIKFNSTTAHIL